MHSGSSEQLDKVLALADSSYDAEAVVAVRKARQMLSRNGLNFSDLARAAQRRSNSSRPFSIFGASQINLEAQIIRLQQMIDDLQVDLKTKDMQVEFWQCRAAELQQSFKLSQTQAERWRQLARDTVEKLWDLGQEVRSAEFAANAPVKADKKSA